MTTTADRQLDSGDMASPAVAPVAAIAAAVDQLLTADLTLPSDADIVDLLRAVEVQSRRLHTASIRVTAQITDRGLAAPAGASSTAALLRQVLPLSAGDAYQRVRLAAATSHSTGITGAVIEPALPILAGALHAGSVPSSNAGIIVTTLNGFPADVPQEVRDSVEEFLVDQAAVLDPKTFHNVARRIALMANPDGPYDERDAAEKQEFHIGRRRADGLTRCWGLFDDLTIESLRAAFGAMCAPAADRNRAADPSAPGSSTPTEQGDAPTPENPAAPEDTAAPDGVAEPDDTEPDDTNPDDTASDDTAAAPPVQHTTCEPIPATGNATEPDSGADTNTSTTPAAGTSSSEPADQPPPRQPWRPTRPPYQWAPLGTLHGDFPPREPAAPPPDPPAAEPPPPPDRRSAATRRAHALGAIMTAFLGSGTAPSIRGGKPHLLVTVTEADLRRGIGSAQLGYGETIPIGAARMIACDAAIIPAVLRGTSEVIDIGRAMRPFTAACRKAILLRDIGCTFPGCPMPGAWCDNHHIQHWAAGGPSNLDNAALLCRRHHNLIHRGQWQVRLGPDRTPEFIPPTTFDPAQQPLRNAMHRPPVFDWPSKR